MLRYATVILFALFGISLLLPEKDLPEKFSLWLFIVSSIGAMVLVGLKISRPVVYRDPPGTRLPTFSALVPVVCVVACVNIFAAIPAFKPDSLVGTFFSGKDGAESIVFISLGIGVIAAKIAGALGYPPFKTVDD